MQVLATIFGIIRKQLTSIIESVYTQVPRLRHTESKPTLGEAEIKLHNSLIVTGQRFKCKFLY